MFPFFVGTYEHNIDEKNRITFPARFREQLGEGAYIIRGFDNNLVVMPSSRFKQLSDLVNALNFGDPDVRDFQRLLFSNASEIEFDKNGRFIIPQNLRGLAKIDGAVVVLGSGEKIEIWSPELLRKREEHFESPNAVAELAKKFNLSF
ncbi:MAG: division/cell wall cluster transcriptional repressor MraZ [Anaerolinea sp.]|nr:division/cell wall cluster transcriptional repressor MraZ [Anaerolinea sp.]